MEVAKQHLFYLVGPPGVELIGFAQADDIGLLRQMTSIKMPL